MLNLTFNPLAKSKVTKLLTRKHNMEVYQRDGTEHGVYIEVIKYNVPVQGSS